MPCPRRRWHALLTGHLAAVVLAFALVVVPAPTPAVAAPTSTWVIDVNALTVGMPFPSSGAAPSMATVVFWTTLGVPNTTGVWLSKPFQQVCVGAGAGTTCPVGDGVGRSSFGSVQRPTLAELRAGARPQVFGTIQWVTDASAPLSNDALPLSWIRTGLEFAGTLTDAAFASGFEIGSTVAWILELVQAGLFGIGGGPRPARVTAMVAVDTALEEQVNLGLLSHRDDLFATAAAAVSDRTLVQPFELLGPDWQPPVVSRYFTTERISQQ
jgi:hypothetical protein